MKDFLSIKNVTFGYGSRTILEDVSLRFGSGQVVAIMGGSGMGKTTLLKLIGGLLTPQAGEICIAGCRVDTNDQKALYRLRRRMGMLFPSSTMSLFPSANRQTWMKKPYEI